MDGDWHVIACNLIEGISEASAGSLAYVLQIPGDPERIHLLLRSRSGRWIQKWESLKRLDNFRAKTLPPEHPLRRDQRIFDWAPTIAARLDWIQRAKAAT